MNHNRPAFLLAAGAIITIMIISFGAFLIVMHGFVEEIAPTIPDVMTDVPTLYYYDDDGEKITDLNEFIRSEAEAELQQLKDDLDDLKNDLAIAEQNGGGGIYNEIPNLKSRIYWLEIEIADLEVFLAEMDSYENIRLEFYWMFSYPALAILFIFIMFASATYYWEKSFSIFQRGTSMKIIKTSVLGMVVIILLPEFWDIYAIEMKNFSMYLIDPFGENPAALTEELWCKMGCIINLDDLFAIEDVGNVILAGPDEGMYTLSDILLPIFKIIPTAMITISFFVIAKIRALFIIIVVITIPIWMVCMNIPTLKKISNDMIVNMIGASIAPIFSALTLSVGMGYVNSTDPDSLEEWITVLGIAIFASVWPIILAPKLSIIASQTTSMVQTAIQSTAMFASNTAGAVSRSASSGLQSGDNDDDDNKNQDLRDF